MSETPREVGVSAVRVDISLRDEAFGRRLAARLIASGFDVRHADDPGGCAADVVVVDHEDDRLARAVAAAHRVGVVALGPADANGWVSRAVERGASDCLAMTDSGIELAPFTVLRTASSASQRRAERERLEQLEAEVAAVRGMQQEMRDEVVRLGVLASTDELTGLLNRRGFETSAGARMSEAQRHGDLVSLMIFDLDALKPVNDVLGHPRGDEVLRALAECVMDSTRASDVAGRLGGDEFAVLMPRIDARSAYAVAHRVLRAHLNHPDVVRVVRDLRAAGASVSPRVARDVVCGVSVGVATIAATESAGLEHLIDGADTALARAKDAGGARVESMVGGAEIRTVRRKKVAA